MVNQMRMRDTQGLDPFKHLNLTGIHTYDWLANDGYHNIGDWVESAYQRVEQKIGRSATDEEVAKELGVAVEEFQKLLGEVGSVVMLSFEELGFGHGEERFAADEWLAAKSTDPLNKLLSGEKVGLIARALDRLPEKERLVISLYFYEELNLKEIGEILGVTESRASQIRSRALIRLKNYLRSAV